MFFACFFAFFSCSFPLLHSKKDFPEYTNPVAINRDGSVLPIRNKSKNLRPIILFPPTYGTNLHATFEMRDAPFYCKKEGNDSLIWMNPTMMVHPRIKCFHELLTLRYDRETDQIRNNRNASFFIHDFGGRKSVDFAAKIEQLNWSYGNSLVEVFEKFVSEGYEEKKNIFAAGFDFRYGPHLHNETYWLMLKSLIEEASAKNDNQKVCLFGFSLGGYMIQWITTHIDEIRYRETNERIFPDGWLEKYVDRLILLAPSFGGNTVNFDVLVRKKTPFLPFTQSSKIGRMMDSWPALHCHFPNHEIYQNKTLVVAPDGTNYSAKDLDRLIIEMQTLTKESEAIFNKSRNLFNKAPVAPNFPTRIFFNSGIGTELVYQYRNWTKKPKMLKEPGDGTIIAQTLDYVCSKWKTNSTLECFDAKNPYDDFIHMPMASNPFILDLIFNSTVDDSWVGKKQINNNHIFDLPHTIIRNHHYDFVENDLISNHKADIEL